MAGEGWTGDLSRFRYLEPLEPALRLPINDLRPQKRGRKGARPSVLAVGISLRSAHEHDRPARLRSRRSLPRPVHPPQAQHLQRRAEKPGHPSPRGRPRAPWGEPLASSTHTNNTGKESCKGENLGLSFLIQAESSHAKRIKVKV